MIKFAICDDVNCLNVVETCEFPEGVFDVKSTMVKNILDAGGNVDGDVFQLRQVVSDCRDYIISAKNLALIYQYYVEFVLTDLYPRADRDQSKPGKFIDKEKGLTEFETEFFQKFTMDECCILQATTNYMDMYEFRQAVSFHMATKLIPEIFKNKETRRELIHKYLGDDSTVSQELKDKAAELVASVEKNMPFTKNL